MPHVHILGGGGSIGLLLASCLRHAGSQVTLLLRRDLGLQKTCILLENTDRDASASSLEVEVEVETVPSSDGRAFQAETTSIACCSSHTSRSIEGRPSYTSMDQSHTNKTSESRPMRDLWEGSPIDTLVVGSGRNATGDSQGASRGEKDATGGCREASRGGRDATGGCLESTGGNSPRGGPITNLIVATKAAAVLPSLRGIQHRLSGQSTVVLIQNGVLAVYEELHRELLSTLSAPPSILIGSITHGCFKQGAFHTVLASGSKGSIQLAPADARLPSLLHEGQQRMWDSLPSQSASDHAGSQSWRPLVDMLMSTHMLNVSLAPSHMALMHLLHRKLAVNCVINPLTALLNVPNGHICSNAHAHELARELCDELFLVIGERHLGVADAEELFQEVIRVAESTAGNRSSMLQDMEAGRQTEVDYLTGYVTRMGRISANRVLLNLIRAKEKPQDQCT